MTLLGWVTLFMGLANAAAVLNPQVTSVANPSPQPLPVLKKRNYEFKENPINTAIKLPRATGPWLTKSCSENDTTDQLADDQLTRYESAGVPEAWADLMDEWNLYLEDAKKYDEPRWSFMAFMSNVFNAPQGKSCSLESESCVINFCQANGKAPASYLIQDSVGFFQRSGNNHAKSYRKAGQAVSVSLADFVKTFAPIRDDSQVIKVLLDGVLFAALALIPSGFSVMAGMNGKVILAATREATVAARTAQAAKQAAERAARAAKAAKGEAEIKAAKEAAAKATQKADDTKKAAKEASDKALKEEKAAQAAKGITDIAEDEAGAKKQALKMSLITNSVVSLSVLSVNLIKDYMKTAKTLQDEHMALKELLEAYMFGISDQFNATISPMMALDTEELQNTMTNLVVTGGLNQMWNSFDKVQPPIWDSIYERAKSMLSGMLLKPAWSANYHPFILRIKKEDYKCGDAISTWKHYSKFSKLMSEETAKTTRVCAPDGHSYFLLDTRTYPTCESRALGCESQKKYKAFAPLPGGDEKTLKEKTGATFKDIIYTSWAGFVKNEFANGYKAETDTNEWVGDDMVINKGDSGLPMSGGLRIPGLFDIPVCIDAMDAVQNTLAGRYYSYGAPCKDDQHEGVEEVFDVMIDLQAMKGFEPAGTDT